MTRETIHKVKEIMIQNNTLVRKPPPVAAFYDSWINMLSSASATGFPATDAFARPNTKPRLIRVTSKKIQTVSRQSGT